MMINNYTQPMRNLPTEIISIILRHLDMSQEHPTLHTCTFVNQVFHSIATPLLWRYPNDSLKPHNFPLLLTCMDRAMEYRRQHAAQFTIARTTPPPGHYIEELATFGHQVNDKTLCRFMSHVPNLKLFELTSKNGVTDASIQRLPRFCKQLDTLALNGIRLTRSCFSALARHCPNLHFLTLQSCDLSRYQDILKPIAQRCPVQCLVLYNCRLNFESIVDDLARFEHLVILQLLNVHDGLMKAILIAVSKPIGTSSDSTSSTMIYPWPVLKSIYFFNLFSIDDTIWINFIKTHPRLEDINIKDAPLTNAVLEPMAQWLPKFTQLQLVSSTRITTEGLQQLILLDPPYLKRIRCDKIRMKGRFPELTIPPYVDGDRARLYLDIAAMDAIRAAAATSAATTSAATPVATESTNNKDTVVSEQE